MGGGADNKDGGRLQSFQDLWKSRDRGVVIVVHSQASILQIGEIVDAESEHNGSLTT